MSTIHRDEKRFQTPHIGFIKQPIVDSWALSVRLKQPDIDTSAERGLVSVMPLSCGGLALVFGSYVPARCWLRALPSGLRLRSQPPAVLAPPLRSSDPLGSRS